MATLTAPPPLPTPTPDRPTLARIEDSEHEIVDGKIVEAAPMGVWECYVATKILAQLAIHLAGRPIGRAISENLFILRRDPLLRRKPDAAFVSAERWAMNRPIPRGEAAWDVIPDLVVEVVSPTDLAVDVHAKIAEYRAAGVRFTWIVYPEQAEIYDYRADPSPRVHGPGEAIDGGDLLPGFALALNDVFELS